jgi:hypothetical protein
MGVSRSSHHQVWSAAATNLDATLDQFKPQLRSARQPALGFAEQTIGAAFQVAVAIIIAGVLFTIASGGYAVARNIASNLASESAQICIWHEEGVLSRSVTSAKAYGRIHIAGMLLALLSGCASIDFLLDMLTPNTQQSYP